MKVYPIIYSRTKLCDYVSGFLVRPDDLNYSLASKYVSNSLNEIKYSDGIRHAIFSVDDYIIYGGTACVTDSLIKRILKEKKIDSIDFIYEKYKQDRDGRPNTFFIGFAIRKSTITNTKLVPNIDLYETYKIYLKHLEKQWLNSITKTEILKVNDYIDVDFKENNSPFSPQYVKYKDIVLLTNYSENYYKDIINYYFIQSVTSRDSNNSFLSNVIPEMVDNTLMFKNIALYGESAEKFVNSKKIIENNVSTESSFSSNDSEPIVWTAENFTGNTVGFENSKNKESTSSLNNQRIYHSVEEFKAEENNTEKKFLPTSWIIIIAIVLLVGIIIILAGNIYTNNKQSTSSQNQEQAQSQPQEENQMVSQTENERIHQESIY